MTKIKIKTLWNKNINNSIVICSHCGKQLKRDFFNKNEEYGWKIIKNSNKENIIVCVNYDMQKNTN